MTKIIIHGCNGKMGQVISNLAKEDSSLEIVAGIDRNDSIVNYYPVFTSYDACNVEADVIIDFTTARATDNLLDFAVSKKLPLVLCTTGLTEEQIEKVNASSKEIPILRSANMSLGVNILIRLLKVATEVLANADFDIEIIEKHHNQKIDAPSGTALALADAINEVLNNEYDYKYDRHADLEKRNKKEIGIHAVRGGSIVGEHSVIFAGIDEVIEFKHIAQSKAIFGKGAIEAAKYLAHKPSGMYDMNDVTSSK